MATFRSIEAATIGGEGTTRYMDTQRYAGDASLYATSELRIPLAQFKLVVPLRAGIIGLAEAGRVYVDGSSPGGWHSRTGEGMWFGQGRRVAGRHAHAHDGAGPHRHTDRARPQLLDDA